MKNVTWRKNQLAGGLSKMVLTLMAVACTAFMLKSAPIMPDYATLPTGWTVDRFEPASFGNVGPYQGRANVLGIGIDATTGESARPAGQQGLFYSTQGRKFTFSPVKGAGSVLSADLFIPASWGNSANGHVRTDMWGTMVDSASDISAYAIIGFSNYGGAPRLRVWDGDIGWVNLTTTITYGTWTRFAIEVLADASIKFYVNGVLVYTDSATGGSVAFKEVIMQAYNFEHSGIVAPIVFPYTAHWSNTDSDGDGVPDDVDGCVDSDLSATVVIDGCNSGVANTLLANGCTISDLIAHCAAGAQNHGQFVSCVAELTNSLKAQGVITAKQKGAIQSCAGKSSIGK